MVTHVQAGWQQQARVANLGLGGACLVVDATDRLHAGDMLTLSFVAPTLWDPLLVRAHVAWSTSQPGEPTQAGVSFEHKNASAVFALFELVAAMAYE